MGFSLKKVFGGGGSSIPGYDTAALNNIAQTGFNKRKSLIEGAFGELPQFGQQYSEKATNAGNAFAQSNLGAAQEFDQGLRSLGAEDKAANEVAVAAQREKAFRDVPEVERRLRDVIGATVGFGSGAAAPQLARPTIDAANAARDFETGLETDRLRTQSQRRETGLESIFGAKQANALQKVGIDLDTAKMLLETGRGDVLEKAMQLSGIEGERAQSLLDIEQLRQSQEIAKAQAKAKKKAGRLGAITSLGGLALGAATGNPLLGLGLGSATGNLISGGETGSLDPLLLSILSRRQAAPAA